MAGQANIEVNIGANGTKLQQGLNQARESVRDWAGKVENHTSNLFKTPHLNLLHLSRGLLTAFSVGGAIEGIKNLVQAGEEAAAESVKMSEKLGVSLEKYDQWKEKAEAMKMPLEELAQIVERIKKAGGGAPDIDRIIGVGDLTQENIDNANTDANIASGMSPSKRYGKKSSRWAAKTLDENIAFITGNWDEGTQIANNQKTSETLAAETAILAMKRRLREYLEAQAEDEALSAQLAKEKNMIDEAINKGEQEYFNLEKKLIKASAAEEKKLHGQEQKEHDADMRNWNRGQKAIKDQDIQEKEFAERLTIHGSEASGLGAVGGYSGANFGSGIWGAIERSTMIAENHLRETEKTNEILRGD